MLWTGIGYALGSYEPLQCCVMFLYSWCCAQIFDILNLNQNKKLEPTLEKSLICKKSNEADLLISFECELNLPHLSSWVNQ